uniref:Uncharacterized protein n=1 Tax=Helianthus annuus TaxID=4232 RepID=A0A251VRB0_HELAN
MIKIDSSISNGSSLPGVDRTNHFFEWRFNSVFNNFVRPTHIHLGRWEAVMKFGWPGLGFSGLGFDIDEIIQAWHELYEVKRWQSGVRLFD